MNNKELCIVLRNIQTNHIYKSVSDNYFKNLTTGKEGYLSNELINKTFKLNTELTFLLTEYPNMQKFIEKLHLKVLK